MGLDRSELWWCEGRWRNKGESGVEFFDASTVFDPPKMVEITATIFRDGYFWTAWASIEAEGQGTPEWMAAAIELLNLSVDMALDESE